MEVAVRVDVMETRYDLPEDGRYETAGKRSVLAGFDELVEIAFHGLEHKIELLGGWEEEKVVERDDVWMRRDRSESLCY
jgi:hypothetical protein